MTAKTIQISASILSADFGKLAESLKLCEDSGVDRIHIDVMDGHFVPNITIGAVVTAAVRKYTRLPIKAHLMIEHPWDYIDDFVKAGADSIAVHAECYGERKAACRNYGQYPKEVEVIDIKLLEKDIERIKSQGKKASVVINPGTPVTAIEAIIPRLDSVLIMSVNPGFAGQKFMPSALDKIRAVRAAFKGDIVVDGGVNLETGPDVVKAGANVLVTASYFFGSKDPAASARALKDLGRF